MDLLILEQLHVSVAFAEWLSARVNAPGAKFHSARHSVYRSQGETDVLLFLETIEGRVAVMIEDKIGAPMQPRQCERYHERGKDLCDRGEAVRYMTVLCAPDGYLRSVLPADRWDHRISLEEMDEWLRQDSSPASHWRQMVLRAAYSKSTRARQADDKSNKQFDPQLLLMKVAYQHFVAQRYPALVASRQTGRDREYYLGARGLPTGIRFKHSFFRGEISLIFESKWAEQASVWLGANAPEDAWLHRHGSEVHLRKSTEVMDPAVSLEAQSEVVVAALDGVMVLVAVAEQFVIEALPRRPLV